MESKLKIFWINYRGVVSITGATDKNISIDVSVNDPSGKLNIEKSKALAQRLVECYNVCEGLIFIDSTPKKS